MMVGSVGGIGRSFRVPLSHQTNQPTTLRSRWLAHQNLSQCSTHETLWSPSSGPLRRRYLSEKKGKGRGACGVSGKCGCPPSQAKPSQAKPATYQSCITHFPISWKVLVIFSLGSSPDASDSAALGPMPGTCWVVP